MNIMCKRFLLSLTVLLSVVCVVSCTNAASNPVSKEKQSPKAFPSQDSIRFANAQWSVDTVCNGLVLKTLHFTENEIFNSNQFMCVLEVTPESSVKLAFAHEPKRTATSVMARKHGAIAAVNASFFDMKYHNPICYLRISGRQVGENTPQKSDTLNRKYYQYATMALYNGYPKFVIPDSNRHWEESFDKDCKDVMTAGPMLVVDNQRVGQRQDRTFVTDRHNRTAIGVKADSTILIFTVDGRMKQSAGMTLDELSQTMMWLGCTVAMNLDGGGSTTCYVRGRGENGMVNYPTDNARFDHKGERKVSSIVMVVPDERPEKQGRNIRKN